MTPCNFDHNGECLICDCWSENCAWQRFLNKDYKWENEEQLKSMFKEWIRDINLEIILNKDSKN